MFVKPSFYDDFKCKADKCEDSCCIGWEVDIDKDSLALYNSITGDFGERLRSSVDLDGECSFFRLCDGEKCPFLDEKGLCDIYKNLGEEALCDICREHPRFYNQTDDVTEMGLGLCCEKVCELLFDPDYTLNFVAEDSYCFVMDDMHRSIIDIINNNHINIVGKINMILGLFSEVLYPVEYDSRFCDKILKSFAETEPINEEWTSYINDLSESAENLQSESVDLYSVDYSKFLLYTLFRHLSKGEYRYDFYYWAMFSCVSTLFVIMCDAFTCYKKGEFLFSDRIENVKRWSKQIEYSTENIEIIMEYF